jgi:hypothetical protein
MGGRKHLTGHFDRPTQDAVVVAMAAEQDWVMTSAELYSVGLTRRQISHRVRNGLLHRRYRGVYAVGRPALSFEGECRAAIAASGPGSAICYPSALSLWGLRKSYGAIHVSVPRRCEGHPGLRIHRPRSFPVDDTVERRGIAVTSVARTLLDAAAKEPADRVAWLMHEAAVQGVLDLRAVWAVLERHQHHRGRGKLEMALALEVAPTRSGLEREFLEICRRAEVPAPLVNHHVWSVDRLEEVDFHWPEPRVIVEVDGARYHSTRWRRRKDAEKTARLQAASWHVRRFSELEIRLDPVGVGAETLQLHALGGRVHP